MNKHAVYHSESIICNCGNEINITSLISDMEFDAMHYGGFCTNNETLECDQCDREHKIELEVSVEIDINCKKIETTLPITNYKDKENNLIPSSFFNNLAIGSKTPNLNDGSYVLEDKELIFEVENEEIVMFLQRK